MTHYLLLHPHTLISLSTFAERFQSAKSSISEDLSIIKDVFEAQGFGQLLTLAGAAGGVKYIPRAEPTTALAKIEEICAQLAQPERILPGDYLYMVDVLGQPSIVNKIGKIFASAFSDKPIDLVMTVETKGISLAYATASYLNVPVITVRRDNKITEGSAVSINYVSGSNKRIQTMSLAKRALAEDANVLIVDDFMKAGGTIQGMIDLLQEFKATVQGVGVFVESGDIEEHLIDDYVSLVKVTINRANQQRIKVEPGNYFNGIERGSV